MHGNELYHHGILGMKWGVRRYQNKDGSLTAAGEKRYSRKETRKIVKEQQELARSHEEKLLNTKYKKEINDLNRKIDEGTTNIYKEDDYGNEKVAYRIKQKTAESAAVRLSEIESSASSEGLAYANRIIEKKYGSQALKDIGRYEIETGAMFLASMAATFGIMVAISEKASRF